MGSMEGWEADGVAVGEGSLVGAGVGTGVGVAGGLVTVTQLGSSDGMMSLGHEVNVGSGVGEGRGCPCSCAHLSFISSGVRDG